jgi:serine/threonine-protein kinase
MPNAESLKERALSRLGCVLRGKWRLDSVLGVGGMATVYAATHRNRSRVAIKLMHPEISSEPEVTERFLREGYLANVIDHPGTAKVLDDDIGEDGSPFLVMELLDGETVEERWERKGRCLPISEALAVADKALDVLIAAHLKGVVHRDLKPENLFLTAQGELKILDFGIARMRELPTELHTRTRLGALLGTPAFMAPEQARGRWDEVDARTDIWALGATLFTLLTTRFVHEGTTLQEQLILAGSKPARSVAELSPQLPPQLIDLVDRALAFDKEERWPDARSMQQALRAAVQSGDERMTLPIPSISRSNGAVVVHPSFSDSATIQSENTTRPVIASTPPPPPERRRSAVPLFLAAGVAIGIVAGVLWRVQVLGGSPADDPVVTAAPAGGPTAPMPPDVDPVPAAPADPPPSPAADVSASATARPPIARPTAPSTTSRPETTARPAATTAPQTPTAAPTSNPFDRRF